MNTEARTDAATRLHHPFSPSSLQCREASPCWSPRANTESEASERGTAQHDAVDAPEIPADLTDLEAMAVEQCKQFFADRLAQCPGVKLDRPQPTTLNEIYVSIDERLITDAAGNEFKGTTGGYLDRSFVSPDGTYAEIFDWKFGAWSVEPAHNNVQGISYLLGLVRLYPKLKTVRVQFVMPHRDEIDWHIFTTDARLAAEIVGRTCGEENFVSLHEPQFADLRLRITTIVERAKAATSTSDYSKCSARTSACLFCGNLAQCSLVADFALRIGKKYAPLQMPENITPSLVVNPESTKARLEAAAVMSQWAQAVRQQETAKCIDDEEWMPSDYVLRRRQDTKVVDEDGVKRLAKETGLSDEQIASALKLSMTPLNKEVRANAPRGSKDKAEEDFKDKLVEAGYLEKQTPSVWLERLKS